MVTYKYTLAIDDCGLPRNLAKQAAAGDCGIKTPCDYRSRTSLVRKTAAEHLKRITNIDMPTCARDMGLQ